MQLQAFPNNWRDLSIRLKRLFEVEGPAFINVMAPCPRGWRYNTPDIADILKLAYETRYWPLYEVENGEWKLNYKPKKYVPVEEWLKLQGRFRHLFRDENRYIIDEIQAEVDRRWEVLLERCGEK